jgi:hypothetical protein
MKFFARLSLMGSGLGVILLTAAPSFATVVGTLNTGGNGTVTVTPMNITFTENDTSGGSTEVASGTTLTYAGSPALTIGNPIDINGGAAITPAELAMGVPITFPDQPDLSMTLYSFGPGSSNTNCSGLAIGQSCSPLLGGGLISPIVLTDEAFGTTAQLSVDGIATDDGGKVVSDLNGLFSANIDGKDPEMLAALGTFTTTYSGQLTLSMSTVPEPRTIILILCACILMGIVFMKRRKRNA